MSTKEVEVLKDVLLDIVAQPNDAWVYLPADRNWSLNSKCAVLLSEEVPPELEDDPLAGRPEFAKTNDLIQALPVTVVQDIVANARAQKPSVNPEDLLSAFLFYFKHDAFLDFGT